MPASRDLLGGGLAALLALPYGIALAELLGVPPELGVLPGVLAGATLWIARSGTVLIAGAAALAIPFLGPSLAAWGSGAIVWISLWSALTLLFLHQVSWERRTAELDRDLCGAFVAGLGLLVMLRQVENLVAAGATLGDGIAAALVAAAAVSLRLGRRRIALGLTTGAIGALWLGVETPLAVPELSLERAMGFAAEARLGALSVPDTAVPSLVGQGIALGLTLAAYHTAITRCLDGAPSKVLQQLGWSNLLGAALALPPAVVLPARTQLARDVGARTAWVGPLHALVLSALLLLVGPRLALPAALLAGLVLAVGLALVAPERLAASWQRSGRRQRAELALTTLIVAVAGPVAGLLWIAALLALRWVAGAFAARATAQPLERIS